MSDERMSAHSNDSSAAGNANSDSSRPAGTPARKLWFAAGLCLWIVAIVMLYQMIRQRTQRNQAGDKSGPAVIVLDSDSGTKAVEKKGNETKSTDEESPPKVETPAPAPIWDPNGIEDFALTERSGRTITKADLLGHDWVVSFIFINCLGPCPRVTAQMYELQRHLKGTDVRLVTITVDPKNDTPERLTSYAKNFNADPDRWLFLTGDQEKIYHLITNSFRMLVEQAEGEMRKPGFEVIHTTNILHVNAKGVVVGKYNSQVDVEMAKLRQALKAK